MVGSGGRGSRSSWRVSSVSWGSSEGATAVD